LEKIEPTDIEEILLGQWMSPLSEKTPEKPGIFGIKTSNGKYMSSDSIGKVFIEREAIGASEEWLPVILSSASGNEEERSQDTLPSFRFAFQSKIGKYLSFDSTKLKLFRADSENIGEQERFIVKVQSQKRRTNRLAIDRQSATSKKEITSDSLGKYEETLMYSFFTPYLYQPL
jgi:hypothetical protein